MRALVTLGLLGLTVLTGCEGKPACAQLRAAMCVRGSDSPMISILCSAGQGMAREASNEDCAEALSSLDLSALSPVRGDLPAVPPITPEAAPDAGQ